MPPNNGPTPIAVEDLRIGDWITYTLNDENPREIKEIIRKNQVGIILVYEGSRGRSTPLNPKSPVFRHRMRKV